MKKSFLIETSVIIAYLKNLPEGREILEKLSGNLFSSVICLAELYEGIFLVGEKDQPKIKKGIDGFFQSLDSVLPVTLKIAQTFGRVRAFLRKKGKIISDLDILIAATCLSEELTLVTLNSKHFQRIPNLRVYPRIYPLS